MKVQQSQDVLRWMRPNWGGRDQTGVVTSQEGETSIRSVREGHSRWQERLLQEKEKAMHPGWKTKGPFQYHLECQLPSEPYGVRDEKSTFSCDIDI